MNRNISIQLVIKIGLSAMYWRFLKYVNFQRQVVAARGWGSREWGDTVQCCTVSVIHEQKEFESACLAGERP